MTSFALQQTVDGATLPGQGSPVRHLAVLLLLLLFLQLDGVRDSERVADQRVDLLGGLGRDRGEHVTVLPVQRGVGFSGQEGRQRRGRLASGVRDSAQCMPSVYCLKQRQSKKRDQF